MTNAELIAAAQREAAAIEKLIPCVGTQITASYIRELCARLEAADAELQKRATPEQYYRCGCRVVWSDALQAFCPTHYKCIPIKPEE